MELPNDVWYEIFSFLPMVYRQPLHYTAMMATKTFRVCRELNQYPYERRNVESFYMRIVRSTYWYWVFPEIQRLLMRPDVLLRRDVSEGWVRNDFSRVYDEYASLSPELTHITYENRS